MGKDENLGRKLFVKAYYKRNQDDECVTITHLVPDLRLSNVEEQEQGTLRACYFFTADAIQGNENVLPVKEYYRGPTVIFGDVYDVEDACVLFGVNINGIYSQLEDGARKFCVLNEGEQPVPVSNSEVTEEEYKRILSRYPDKIAKIVATANNGCITNGRSYSENHQKPGGAPC